MSTRKKEIDDNCITVRQLAKELMPAWKPTDWFKWPPDLFALTSTLLKTTGLYRYAVSPYPSTEERLRCLDDQDTRAVRWDWYEWMRGETNRLPKCVAEAKKVLFDEDHKLDFSGNVFPQKICTAILQLHALADMACAGFGLPVAPHKDSCAILFLANFMLETNGTLSHLPTRHGVVLPKMRTPQSGLTLRSFSMHITFHQSEVNVRWRSIPWVNQDENIVNVMAIPFPYSTSSQSFKPCEYPGKQHDVRNFEYFEYQPEEEFEPEEVIRLLTSAHREVNRVHIIVFPELALTKSDLDQLKAALENEIEPHRIPMVIAGIRDEKNNGGKKERRNQVVLTVFFAGKWYDLSQDKHHRWKLDEHQIEQYSLAGGLNVRSKWWEGVDLRDRYLTFLAANDWLTICPLICEDLAQLEPVSALIRGVGPTLVIAILMDGPQLAHRWSARYVSVLADDPGTSILTVTSLGMALRCRAKGMPPNRTVAFWKDRSSGPETLELKDGAKALLLTIHAKWDEEFTADARSDESAAAVCVLRGWMNLVPEKEEKKESENPHEAISCESRDVKELTVFAYLVDAIIDAPDDLMEDLQKCALTDESWAQATDVRLKSYRPFKTLWQRITRALEKDRDFKDWPSEEFKLAVKELGRFIHLVNSEHELAGHEEHTKLDRWKELVEAVESALKKSRNLKAMSGRTTGRKELKRVAWVHGIVQHSLLWAIHNRGVMGIKWLTDELKRTKYADHKGYRDLLDEIEECRRFTNHIEEVLRKYPATLTHLHRGVAQPHTPRRADHAALK